MAGTEEWLASGYRDLEEIEIVGECANLADLATSYTPLNRQRGRGPADEGEACGRSGRRRAV